MEGHRVLAVDEGTEQDAVKSRKTKGCQNTLESRKKGMNRANFRPQQELALLLSFDLQAPSTTLSEHVEF